MNAAPEEIRRVIAWQLCDAMPPGDQMLKQIYADDIALASLGVDSLDRVELSMTLEEKFTLDPDIPAETYEKWATVGDVIRYVADRTEGRDQ